MQELKLKPTVFIALLLIATFIVGVKILSPAKAVHGNNPAILAIWHEGVKSNVVILSTVDPGNLFVLEVNATDAGNLRGFDITVKYDPLIIKPLVATDVDFNGADCPSSQGCVFDGISTLTLLKQVDSPTGQTRLSITIVDTLKPFASGTGTLFRITFTVQGVGPTMINIVEGSSSLLNPGQVPYQGIDGYLDNRNTASVEFDYTVVVSPTSRTVNRPVSGSTSTTVSVTVTLVRGSTRTISLRLLSVPQGVSASFVPTSGSPTYSSTLTLTINGGPAGGSTTAPSGTYRLALTGNGTVTAGHFVRTAWLTLIIVPPPPPDYALSASPASGTLSIHQGGWALVTVTASLISGTAEDVTLSSNINQFLAGATVFAPFTGTLPFMSQMNISLLPSVDPGTYKFNVTGISTGQYSEVSVVRRIINYTITVLPFDISVLSTSMSRNIAYSGVTSNPVTVTMNVKNTGTTTRTVTITAKAINSTHVIIIGTTTATLTSLQSTTVTYSWNPHLLKLGTYAVYGEATLANPADGVASLAAGDMTVRFKGDVNNDCTVNIIDLALVGASFGASGGPPPSPNWNIAADLNNDNTINIIDLANVGGTFGQSCP